VWLAAAAMIGPGRGWPGGATEIMKEIIGRGL
jgi:hypothetical protein